jgi:hypothetical protein
MVLPGDFVALETIEFTPMKSIPTDPDSDFARSLPFDQMPHYLGLNVFDPKPGAIVILRSNPRNAPILLFHEIGEGSSMIHSPDWGGVWHHEVKEWEYFLDLVSNMLHMVAGLEIPQDPALIHALRQHFSDFDVSSGMILNMVDFADKFGANTDILLIKLEGLNEKRGGVNRLYLDQEYEQALEAIQNIEGEVFEVYDLALRIKDQALVWVYITEVAILTGTSMICGAIVWTLMVRRKLYREVSTTRPKRMDWEA